jgi:hypothetical protein
MTMPVNEHRFREAVAEQRITALLHRYQRGAADITAKTTICNTSPSAAA